MAEIKFEEALKKLEKIVVDLESGKFSLEDSLKKFEEGVRLTQGCSKVLESAQKRVDILSKKDGGFELKPFEESSES